MPPIKNGPRAAPQPVALRSGTPKTAAATPQAATAAPQNKGWGPPDTGKAWGSPAPAAEPAFFPGPNGTKSQFRDFVDNVLDNMATSISSSIGNSGTVQERAVMMAAGLQEPELPGANATPQEMLVYEKKSKEFDRMFQMLSNAIKNREETLAAINRNV